MLRPKGTPYKVAKQVLKNKGIKVRKPEVIEKTTVRAQYLQH